MHQPDPRHSDSSCVVVITGASAGVGRATARAFTRLGRPNLRLVLLARGRAGLAAAQAEAEAAGAEVLALPTDVADPVQVEAAAAAADARFGPPDVWVNNAMTSVFSPVRDLLPEEIRRVTEVTYLGQVYGAMAALRRMLPRDRGVIVMVGSALAYRGIPLQSAYYGAKHAIQGFTERGGRAACTAGNIGARSPRNSEGVNATSVALTAPGKRSGAAPTGRGSGPPAGRA